MISFDDFNKLDIRIGIILEAEKVEGADKLLKLLVDIGDEKRTLVAGIAETYTPEDIVDKQIPILINLEPKKLRGIESNGMILAVDIGGKATLIHPDKQVPNGSKVR
ncbi:MAG: methionine--tRNA ligase subunit beta [Candidatus Portnoybacteria bacterium RBG_13_40_8]|uniref:Methionine--tRNA ligase n=1 Tax=Candidatus Portnoybacteria bacterium RBG_13_40_8 TaxID=1801990 RepID=A0A1G2F467_9BACT|nr:MAG: methionine--tRNA ligase subunit beta [Candidatus Portnoybacteria bacterium RBG_13_40_8]OGZ35786.1 MAG: methionine--tRNA ligase subunit beta [Candidatus Portnoybacteria bacterium RIFCSPHIGHO2_01_FULL_39_19]